MWSSRKADGTSSYAAERPAADAADLLAPKGDNGAAPGLLDGLDRRDYTERAVELPSLRNGVEMRADPHVVAAARAADEVAVRIDLDARARPRGTR